MPREFPCGFHSASSNFNILHNHGPFIKTKEAAIRFPFPQQGPFSDAGLIQNSTLLTPSASSFSCLDPEVPESSLVFHDLETVAVTGQMFHGTSLNWGVSAVPTGF